MSDAEAIVRAYFDSSATSGNLIAAMDKYCAPDLVWANTGLPTAEGLDACKGFMSMFIDKFGLDSMRVEWVAVASAGGTVVTERIDHLNAKDGSTIASLPVAGTFEVRDGQIAAWRDYFDPRPFLSAL